MNPTYVPNLLDVIKTPDKIKTVRETRIAVDSLTVNLIEPPQNNLARTLHLFDIVDAFAFNFDLATYDRYIDENGGCNTLEKGLQYFKSVCQSRAFTSKPIVLFMVNSACFERKLKTSSFSPHFKDYRGENHVDQVVRYILNRCKQVMTSNQVVFCHTASDDTNDRSTAAFFETTMLELSSLSFLQQTMGIDSPTAHSRDFWTRASFAHTI